jgi:UrcA family protein
MTSVTLRFNEYRRTAAALSALTACLVLGTSASAHAAAPTDEAPFLTVAYSDLNLATEQGTKALYARIVSAARQVCGAGSVDIRDLRANALVKACETRAVAAAVHHVNSPRLAAIYAAHLRHG